MRLNWMRYCIGAAVAIAAIACGAKSDGPTPPGSAQIFSDAFGGTAVDVSKWTIITQPELISIDPSKGSPAPSLLFAGGHMQAVQTINSDPGYTLSFDIAHTAGTGGVFVWAKRVQGTPANYDSYAQFSYFGGGTTPSVAFRCVGGSSPDVPFTDDAAFHHFVLTVTPSGACSWTRDGVVLYAVQVLPNLGLYNLWIYSGNLSAGRQYHVDNMVVTSP